MSKKEKNPRLGVVGGQAVLEGIMMRHGKRYSVAVRRENGDIAVSNSEHISLRKRFKLCNIPIIRGVINMVESLILSFDTLETSAKQFGLETDEGEEMSRFEKWIDKHFGDKILNIVMVIATVLGLGLGIGLFLLLPSFLTGLLDTYVISGDMGWWKNLIEGLIKIVIFVAYLVLISCMKDIRRTFEYHGAEHKTIFCYEAGEELTPENVKKYKRFHPRCGTSFMFVAILVSILISSLPFVTWDNIALRFITKLALLPLIVGLSFEFIMLAGKHENFITKLLSVPGMLAQRLTTREPDERQIEVAIHALKSSMPEEFPDFVPQILVEGDKEYTQEELIARDSVMRSAKSNEETSETTSSIDERDGIEEAERIRGSENGIENIGEDNADGK